ETASRRAGVRNFGINEVCGTGPLICCRRRSPTPRTGGKRTSRRAASHGAPRASERSRLIVLITCAFSQLSIPPTGDPSFCAVVARGLNFGSQKRITTHGDQ